MLRATMNYVTKPPPIPSAYIDGYLYCFIAFFGAAAAAMSSDEAAKYVVPEVLFWVRTFCGCMSATLLALKMFRSTTFSQHLAEKAKDEEDKAATATGSTGKAAAPQPQPTETGSTSK